MGMKIEKSWHEKLKEELGKPYIQKLKDFLHGEKEFYPPAGDVFNAFLHTPFDQVKVVIVGQDPYHGEGQAHGLAFSVPDGVEIPPSLHNIFLELKSDLGVERPKTGNLTSWAKQGVLLLNATLTVRPHQPASHFDKGWERFTDSVIQKLSEKKEPLVFLLWGRFAQEKCKQVAGHHLILSAPHPSPLSAHRGFFGCRHFSKANGFLVQNGQIPIQWS
jgi:uracil-DNA glycosylase